MKRYKIKMWYKIPREIKRKKYTNERYKEKDYMNMYIFKDFEEMYAFVDKEEGQIVERDYKARCYSVLRRYYLVDDKTGEKTPTDRYSPLCGNLYFVYDFVGVNTVSHECLHGVLGYFNRKIDRPERIIDTNLHLDDFEIDYTGVDDIEELMCYMHGGMVEQVWNSYYDYEKNCIDK